MYTLKQIVGNLLLSCETDPGIKFTAKHVTEFAAKLDYRQVTEDAVLDVCRREFPDTCLVDEDAKTFSRKEGRWMDLDDVNKSLTDLRDVVYIEAYARWYVARTFKGERGTFLQYLRSQASFAKSAMDCVR